MPTISRSPADSASSFAIFRSIAPAGKALVITGANGAGKTTLIRALAGFIRPEAGRIELKGGDPERDRAEQCHYVGHLAALKANLTAFENLVFWSDYLATGSQPQPVAERVNAALTRFSRSRISPTFQRDSYRQDKSGVFLSRAFWWRSGRVWLLDEPTSSLDDASTQILAGILNEHVAAGGIVVAATHLPLGLANTSTLRLGDAGAAA